ncbi:MAG: hypothetical protein DYG89_16600 [Caldilinea sp. CFX5]|nr:hypothetical protein [Caldilinea sp. CFX5]
MREVKLRETTAALLAEPLLGDGEIDSKILHLLAGEYQRRLADAQAVNQRLSQKYETTYADFQERRTTVQYASSWEVETDTLAWEKAIADMVTLPGKLEEIAGLTDDAAH